jgi:hypothetical protein
MQDSSAFRNPDAGDDDVAGTDPFPLSKAQSAIVRFFSRNREEEARFSGMALRHNACHENGRLDPYSKSLGARDAMVDLMLRSVYDRPYLSIAGPLVAFALYLVLLAQLGLLLASHLGGHA